MLEAPGSRALRDTEQRLRRAQRCISRKDRIYGKAIGAPHARRSPSRRWELAGRRIALLHRQVRDQRQTRLHQLSRQLVELGALLVLEDLNVSGMSRRGGAKKRGLNRHLHDAALGELRRQLTYKLPTDRLLLADRLYPSSKRCSNCGAENQDLTLAVRAWTCARCGSSHDRDVNAAANLAAWGEVAVTTDVLASLFGGVEHTQSGDRHGGGPRAGRRTPTRHARRRGQPTRRDLRAATRSRVSAAGRNGNPAADDVSSAQDRDCSGQELLAYPHPR